MLRGFLVAWLTLAVQGELLLHHPICEVPSLENNMEAMDMGIARHQARLQNNGSYLARLPFTMGGIWRVDVLITIPNTQAVSATFEVTVQ